MDDDFNTALAIAHLFDGVRTMNRLVCNKKIQEKARAGCSGSRSSGNNSAAWKRFWDSIVHNPQNGWKKSN